MDPVKLALLCVGLGTFLVVGGSIVMFFIDSRDTRTSEQIAADDAAWKVAKRARRDARRWQPESPETASDLVESPST